MEMKTCACCGEELPATLEFFHKRSGTADGLQYTCKSCKKKHSKKHYADNKEYYAEYYRLHCEDNKERMAEYGKKWRENNKEYDVERKRQWRENNQDKINSYTAKYRATKAGATVGEPFTPQDVLDKWGTDCHICSEPIDLNDWHQDHVIPLTKGGEHSLANVKPSHPYCNLSKGNKIYETIQF